VTEGSYAFQNREVVYTTHCPNCPHLAQCKQRRAPVEDCDTVGDVEFLVDGKRSVFWSGVIELSKIDRIVKDYLEGDPPSDVAMGAVQMRMEFCEQA
jgi:hypothetical protein